MGAFQGVLLEYHSSTYSHSSSRVGVGVVRGECNTLDPRANSCLKILHNLAWSFPFKNLLKFCWNFLQNFEPVVFLKKKNQDFMGKILKDLSII